MSYLSPTPLTTVSPRLGRSRSYKEQYAYVYRSDKLCARETWVYSDPGNHFAREPYLAQFLVNGEALNNFVVVGLHTAPDDTPHELRELDNVAKEIRDVRTKYLW